MNPSSFPRRCKRLLPLLGISVLSGCSLLFESAPTPTHLYSLDSGTERSTPAVPASGPSLGIAPPRAAPGFDTPHIVYVRKAHQFEYFARSEWVALPARMLEPLLVAALVKTGAFGTVMLNPRAAHGEFRLDTEIVRLQHEFGRTPSAVHFTLRAYLVEDKTRHVRAWREFDTVVAATSETPYGGVIAANRAVAAALDQLAAFCAEAVRTLP